MVSTRTTKSPRILIERTRNGRPMTPLIDALREQGFDVNEEESASIGAHSTAGAVQDVLNEYDMVFLVVRQTDGVDVDGPIKPFQQLLREAGLMQGKIGMSRVVLLVENTVNGLSADTGVGSIRFPPDRPNLVANEVMNRIAAAFPPDERDLHERVPIPMQARSADLRIPWLLVGVVLIAAMIPFLLALVAIGSGGIGGGGDEPTETMQDLSRVLGGAVAGAAGPAATDGEPDGEGGTAAGAIPAVPGGGADGAEASLPATCVLDLTKGTLLDDAIQCDGAGLLEVFDRVGPWHNDLTTLVLGEGVVGELIYEAGGGLSDAERIVILAGGLINLDPRAAAFGVDQLTLQFSGDDQHVHFIQGDPENGDTATLRFTLDR